MSKFLTYADIDIQIDTERHDGGYNLILDFPNKNYSLSRDFSKGDRIISRFTFPAMTKRAFESYMRSGKVYSLDHDKWACTRVSIRNNDVGIEWSVATDREPRNKNTAGPNDHPLTFGDFFVKADPPSDWMKQYLKHKPNKTLNDICLLGAHNAGLSCITARTLFGIPDIVLCQTKSIAGLLHLGVRYFDIRPVWTGTEFACGHYSDKPGPGHQGANGVFIDQVISDINNFTANRKELVVIKLSHDLDTTTRNGDLGAHSYKPLSENQFIDLLYKFKNIQNLFYLNSGEHLTSTNLNLMIGSRSAVVIIIEKKIDDKELKLPADLEYKGFYYKYQYDAYDHYADTNNPKKMEEDQLQKMKQNISSYFLLSWTLTQSEADIAACIADAGIHKSSDRSILAHGRKVNALLLSFIEKNCGKKFIPNIIFLDAIEDDVPCTVVEYINYELV